MGILDSKLGDDTDEAKDGINGFSFLNFDGERTLCDNFCDILVILEDEPEDELEDEPGSECVVDGIEDVVDEILSSVFDLLFLL